MIYASASLFQTNFISNTTLTIAIGGLIALILVLLLYLFLIAAEKRWRIFRYFRPSSRMRQVQALRPYTRQISQMESFRNRFKRWGTVAEDILPENFRQRTRTARSSIKQKMPRNLSKNLDRMGGLNNQSTNQPINQSAHQPNQTTNRQEDHGIETAAPPSMTDNGLRSTDHARLADPSLRAKPTMGLHVGRLPDNVYDYPLRMLGDRIPIGERIGRYQIDAFVGEGGIGSTYQAYDSNLDQKVAFKSVHPDLLKRSDFLTRFETAVKAAAQLDHPSILPILNAEPKTVRVYTVYDYLSGPTIDSYIQRLQKQDQRMSINETLRLIAQAADALGYAHRSDMVHGRIKPSNMLLQPLLRPDRDGDPPLRVMLADFGMLHLFTGDEESLPSAYHGLLPYLSPEQARGEALDSRSDIYALGMVLYHLVTGQRPFTISDPAEAREKHSNQQPPLPSSIRPVLPQSVETIILTAIAKDPDDRYQTGEEMAAALRQVVIHYPTDAEAIYSAATAGQPIDVDTIIITGDGEKPLTYGLEEKIVRIGAAPDNDIVLPARGIADYHLRLEQSENGWRVIDLGSIEGSYIETNQLLPDLAEDWEQHQALRVGPYTINWQRTTTVGGSEGPAYVASASEPTPNIPGHGVTATAKAAPIDEIITKITPSEVILRAGERTDIQVSITNQSLIVDHFDLQLNGIPPEWVKISEDNIQLMPGGQTYVLMTIHPPYDSSAIAQNYPIQLSVYSRNHEREVSFSKAKVVVHPFTELTMAMHPERLRNKGNVEVTLHNKGNVSIDVALIGRDPANDVLFELEQQALYLQPDEQVTLPVDVQPRKRGWFGATQLLPFEVEATIPNIEEPETTYGQLEVRPRIPSYVPVVAMVLFAFLCAGATLFSSIMADRRNQAAVAATETAVAMQATAAAIAAIPPTPTLPPPVATPSPFPASCAMISEAIPGTPDGDYIVYIGGDETRPVQLYCHNMADRPTDFITLANINAGFNYSTISYPEGALVTHYQRLRIDPGSLIVDTTDRTFATTFGTLPGYSVLPADMVERYQVIATDFARAEGCNRGISAPAGTANIDLTGTNFVLADGVTFSSMGGALDNPQFEISPNRQIVNLSVNGRCAHMAPDGGLRLQYVNPNAGG